MIEIHIFSLHCHFQFMRALVLGVFKLQMNRHEKNNHQEFILQKEIIVLSLPSSHCAVVCLVTHDV